jgi:ABC-type Mn2+/Zn2+ transport system ATPase subunit
MSVPLLDLTDVALGYPENGEVVPLLQGVSLSVAQGEFVVLEGANGSGKTTLLKGILGMLPPLRGTIRWHVERTRIGYIPQEATLDPDIPATALDVVMTAAFNVWPRNKANALAMLAQVGLADKAQVPFGKLSGGQKRRTLLARALAGEPAILVLDEPTVNVDRETEQAMETLLAGLCRNGHVGVLAVTHAAHWARQARRLRLEQGGLHG